MLTLTLFSDPLTPLATLTFLITLEYGFEVYIGKTVTTARIAESKYI